jgi:RimJ/RimL family protein N-acetyltransferase
VLIIELMGSGAPIGTVGWHKVGYGPGTGSDAWNIGIELRPEARGHGFGTQAQRQLADWLFANTSVNRVEASTDVENLAEQRSLEKAGYVREGIQRGAQFRAGAYHDLVTYSRLRTDKD